MYNFEEASLKGKEAMDAMLKTYSDITKGFQGIAAEAADYSKKSFQDGVAHMEALAGTRSIEAAMELQTSFVKSSYEGFVAQSTKMSEMYADLAKAAYKPYESAVAKAEEYVAA
jgi:phasin family protein